MWNESKTEDKFRILYKLRYIAAMRDELPLSVADVLDVGLSDHRLLRWSTSFARPCPVGT